MKVESVFVTGANRGIGLEFVRQFSQLEDAPNFIFATYRSPQSLQDLKNIQDASEKSRVILIKMDVTVQEELEAAKQIVAETVGERGLNLLINNAGRLQPAAFPGITPENLELQFKTNTVGPVMVLQTLFPLLEMAANAANSKELSASRAAVLNISSIAGSIQAVNTTYGSVTGYNISKAALNMAMRVVAAQVKEKGVLVVNMCPGWVKTDMGGKERAELEPQQSISAIMQTLPKLNDAHQGAFMDRFANLYSF